MTKIENSKDPKIQKLFEEYYDKIKTCTTIEFGKGQINIKPKFRGIDPLVYYKEQYLVLSEINKNFSIILNLIKEWCQNGYGINYQNKH